MHEALKQFDETSDKMREVVLAIVNERITKPEGMIEIARIGEEFLGKFDKVLKRRL